MPYIDTKNFFLKPQCFVTIYDINNIISKGILIPYSVHAQRVAYANLLNSVFSDFVVVCSINHRFPATGIFVDLAHPQLSGLLADLATSLDLSFRHLEKAMASVPPERTYSKLEDSRTLFYNTLERLSLVINQPLESSSNSGVYTRSTFEAVNGLRWE